MSKDSTGKRRFNWNWVALAILIIAYVFSAARFFSLSMRNKETENSKIIRVAHWQLEPGYREAMEWAMNEYNNLPHVKEAGITVTQIPMPARVYNQFMNVHLISGTAPDIAAAANTTLIQGNSIARFYATLGTYANEPNPYNAQEYLSPDLDPKLREYLIGAPWKDTFLDGMEGGWKSELNDYYSVPISNIGGQRLFYNMKLLAAGKAYIRQALAQSPEPQWLQNAWIHEANGEKTGYLPNNNRLHQWLANDEEIPQTLGQLILFCLAIQEMSKTNEYQYVVPISVGNYYPSDPINRYSPSFYRLLSKDLEFDGSSGISGLEAIDGLKRGKWSMHSEPLLEFIKLSRVLTSFYPSGYLGLDREQIQRRFVSGQAAVYGSGSWDASSVYQGVQSNEDPTKRFEIKIGSTPMPTPDERWGDMLDYIPSEANFKAGVPLSINKQSHNFDWALDFLMFISSQPVNEELNQIAEWLPATIGAETTDGMLDFAPIIEGFPGEDAFGPTGFRSNLRTQWKSNLDLVIAGELDYEVFAKNFMEYVERRHQGYQGYWRQDYLSARDRSLAQNRVLSVEEFKQIEAKDDQESKRFRSLFYQSLITDEGINLETAWHNLHPGEPFPTGE